MSKLPKDYLKLAGRVSKETGFPLDDILHAQAERAKEIKKRATAPKGKYRIIGIDKFDGGDWVHADRDDLGAALKEARELTNKGKENSWSHDFRTGITTKGSASIGTVYYVYNDKGEYLGGDTYYGE